MAHLDHDNPFQKWVLTPEEFTAGSQLTLTQKQCIQNQIAALATQRINLEMDATNPLKTLQQESYLKGQIDSLQYLLTVSTSVEAQLNPGAQPVTISPDQSQLFPSSFSSPQE